MTSARNLYIGSYSVPSPWTGAPHAHGKGVSMATLDVRSGAMRLGPTVWAENPSFLVSDQERGVLWAITEPETGGDMLSFGVEENGSLQKRSTAVTGADAPCHLTVDQVNRVALVSHYHGACVSLLALDDNVRLIRSVAQFIPQPLPGRNAIATPPRPHSSLRIVTDEVLVADAGLDLMLLCRLVGTGEAAGMELLHSLQLPQGTGPRHMAWRESTGTGYVSNQNVGSVTVIERVQSRHGPSLRLRSIVESGSLGRADSIPSEISLNPGGTALYMANRLDNSLSVFGVDRNGDIQLHSTVDVQGTNPRHFRLTNDGGMLLIANQDSDEVTSFRVSTDGLAVEWTGQRLEVATPTCVTFW